MSCTVYIEYRIKYNYKNNCHNFTAQSNKCQNFTCIYAQYMGWPIHYHNQKMIATIAIMNQFRTKVAKPWQPAHLDEAPNYEPSLHDQLTRATHKYLKININMRSIIIFRNVLQKEMAFAKTHSKCRLPCAHAAQIHLYSMLLFHTCTCIPHIISATLKLVNWSSALRACSAAALLHSRCAVFLCHAWCSSRSHRTALTRSQTGPMSLRSQQVLF